MSAATAATHERSPAPSADVQQRDYLCGPFHAARLLRNAGVREWEERPIDQDLIAARAGTVLPARNAGPAVPPGARRLRGYRVELALGSPEESGTASDALAEAIETTAGGSIRCLPLRGRWSGDVVERLVEAAPKLDARLVANVRTGRLWGSRPPLAALLATLDGAEPADPPPADWDVGHYVELYRLLRGAGGSLVLVVDSYPELGWKGHHLQPPGALASALERGDGLEGGVLAVAPAPRAPEVEAVGRALGLEIGCWDNGTRRR